jgi:Fe-Mn family superoxide dismutase
MDTSRRNGILQFRESLGSQSFPGCSFAGPDQASNDEKQHRKEISMLHATRREFLSASAVTGAALTIGGGLGACAEDKKPGFTLPKLPYAYDALEPHIDAETMMIHHDKHHQAYVDNLNKALAGQPALLSLPIDQLMRQISSVPDKARQAVIYNGGGHANHTLFWEIMGPGAGGAPRGELATAIDAAFGSFDKFKAQLSQAAATRFGSGWGWLIVDGGKLKVMSSANQDSPLMKAGQTPILGLDVWEHAYYLKYRNKRPDYIKAWWNVVAWDKVADKYTAALKG